MIFAKLRYWSVYTLFRWQFIFIAVGMWIMWNWVLNNLSYPEWYRANVWMQVMSWSFGFIAMISILSLLLAWMVFRMRIKSGKLKVSVRLAESDVVETGVVPQAGIIRVEGIITNVLRPFLGTVQLRLIFPEWNISEFLVLDENKKGFFNPLNTISGSAKVDLHHRGLHEVEEVQVVLMDMLKLISIPISMHSGNTLLTLPRELKEENFEIFPTATEEQEVRINIPRRVQGEFLSYKDFESGDDIRRIVWKIYAKNGELVVRIPETRDPYASHVYIGCGFYNTLIGDIEAAAGRELLNFYKDYLRQLYDAVKHNQEYSIRMLKDQEVELNSSSTDVSDDIFYIATAHWQNDQRPVEVFDTTKAAVICLSSATPVEEIAALFEKLPAHVPVIVYALSTSLGPLFRFSVKKIFFKEKSDPLKEIRETWWASPTRKKLKMNEDRIQELVRMRGNSWLMQMKSNA